MQTLNSLKIAILCSVLALTLAGCGSGEESPLGAGDGAEAVGGTAAGETGGAAITEPSRVEIPSGTTVVFELVDGLSAAGNDAGQTFSARVAEDVVVNGDTLVRAGAMAEGRILEATESGRVQGVAEIALQMSSISVGGNAVPISTETFEARAETSRTEDATTIGAGAGIGAAIGGILGGGDGAALGAAIGGGGGTAVVLSTRGDDIELPSGTRINFVLSGTVMLP